MIDGQAATVGSCCSPGVDVLADQGSDGPICCGRCTATLPVVQQRTHGHGWWRPKAPVGPRAPPVGTVRPDGSDDVARGGSARGWAAAAVFCAAGGTASSARKERTTRAATSRSASARPGWELTLRFLRATLAEPTAQGLAIETDGRHRRRTFHRRDTPVTTAHGSGPHSRRGRSRAVPASQWTVYSTKSSRAWPRRRALLRAPLAFTGSGARRGPGPRCSGRGSPPRGRRSRRASAAAFSPAGGLHAG